MSDLSIVLSADFESIRQVEFDLEYWSARDLMPVLGYEAWQRFADVIQKAITSCQASGNQPADHFIRAGRRVTVGSGAGRIIEDYLLTRFACYLVAQNGDPRKPQIAIAQTYFAAQTRKQELEQQRANEDKRLESRQKLRTTESKIESTVYSRGIRHSSEFATFKNRHVEALYGGISIKTLKKKRNIPGNRALADFDTDVELKAKDFALAMTDHNIKANNLLGLPALENEVVSNSKAARNALLQRGIIPEHLKPEEDLKIIEQRKKAEQRLIEQREQGKLQK
jgi:DNA-damage-inducible protein D